MDGTTTGDATRIGLLVATPQHECAAGQLAHWLITSATIARPDLLVDPVDLARDAGGAARSTGPRGPGLPVRDGYVLLVPQYGPVPAPEVEATVTAHDDRWAGRPVGLVAYGGVSRGRDAATRIRGLLTDGGASVLEVALGINVAQVRREGGPGAFEELGWQMLLDGLAREVGVRTAAG